MYTINYLMICVEPKKGGDKSQVMVSLMISTRRTHVYCFRNIDTITTVNSS